MGNQAEKLGIMRGYVNSLHAVHLLYYGVELGFFDALRELGNTFTPAKLADRLNYHPLFVEYWCQAAYAIDVLEYKGDKTYFIDDEWLEIFTNEESNFYARYLPSVHLKVAEFSSLIPSSLREGKIYGFDDASEDFIRAVERDSRRFINFLINEVVPKFPLLEKRLQEGGTILDIGCGTAMNLVILAGRFPNAKFIGVDISEKSIALARKNISQAGLESKISVHCQCASEFTTADRIDVITFIESIHEINHEVWDRLIASCGKILTDDGLMTIFDCIMPTETADLNKGDNRTMAICQWFESGWGSKVPTREEINNLLTRHHFTQLEEIPLGDTIIAGIARKTH